MLTGSSVELWRVEGYSPKPPGSAIPAEEPDSKQDFVGDHHVEVSTPSQLHLGGTPSLPSCKYLETHANNIEINITKLLSVLEMLNSSPLHGRERQSHHLSCSKFV